MKVKKAEITAFLSLIVVLLISFIFGIIEITVIQTEKNLSRICADGAIFSVFGEYESQLMEAYHIFGLDGSYGTGEFNEDKIIGRMHYYSNKNIDYKINGIQYLTDNKGQAFREQEFYLLQCRRICRFQGVRSILICRLQKGVCRQEEASFL